MYRSSKVDARFPSAFPAKTIPTTWTQVSQWSELRKDNANPTAVFSTDLNLFHGNIERLPNPFGGIGRLVV